MRACRDTYYKYIHDTLPQYTTDTVLCAPAVIRTKYIYNTLPQYTKDTVLCAPAEIRTKYVLNTLPILGKEYDWQTWVLCVAIEYVRNTLQYVAYCNT